MWKMERRNYKTEIELRDHQDEKIVRGYAALYNSDSEDLGGFTERIAPGFFDGVLGDDVRALRDHTPSMVLGRTKSGTLTIGTDERGLWYEYTDPDTSYSRDLLKSMKRGDVDQSSFGFSVEKDNWEEVDGRTIRTLLKAGRLYDVSPVTYPAYPDTSVAQRGLKEYMATSEEALEKDRKERKAIIDKIDRLNEQD